ncbi:hypothetical protein [Clostridium lundense]|uniref:hypothetical protein n=1 Tax=Clostridium lundense TaxID=319475 RepID=UPI000483CE94|nr:hypothetical protein [Clostridium lundense]
MFQVSLTGFYIIASIICIMIFSGIVLSFLKFRHNINGKKIMLLGLCLIILGFEFLNLPGFKLEYSSLNYLILFLGIILIFVGFCFKD